VKIIIKKDVTLTLLNQIISTSLTGKPFNGNYNPLQNKINLSPFISKSHRSDTPANRMAVIIRHSDFKRVMTGCRGNGVFVIIHSHELMDASTGMSYLQNQIQH